MNQFLQKIVDNSLLLPAFELDKRSKKCLRSELVLIGCKLAKAQSDQIETAQFLGQLVESLHTGSLIIDDIQDSSSVRRNGPCVHVTYGVPLSINAGNWLYFSALHQLDATQLLNDTQKLACYRSISRVMYWAHIGQAIDLGTQLETLTPSEIIQVCEKSLLMKSGYLTGLSFELGAIAASANEEIQKSLFDFGCQFGLLLQKFDDVGNLKLECQSQKDLEDLILMRPSWVWSCAYSMLESAQLSEFKNAVKQLPEKNSLIQILNQTGLRDKAYQTAVRELENWLHQLKTDFKLTDQCENFKNLNSIGTKLKNAYT